MKQINPDQDHNKDQETGRGMKRDKVKTWNDECLESPDSNKLNPSPVKSQTPDLEFRERAKRVPLILSPGPSFSPSVLFTLKAEKVDGLTCGLLH